MERDTVTIVIRDTVTIVKPQPSEVTQLPSAVVRLPLWRSQNPERRTASDSLCSPNADCEQIDHFPDSAKMVDVVLPIERKVYEDSTYRAVISGAFAALDSITVYPRREVQRITISNRPRRWGLGVSVGYGITRNGVEPFLGISIHYNFWSW